MICTPMTCIYKIPVTQTPVKRRGIIRGPAGMGSLSLHDFRLRFTRDVGGGSRATHHQTCWPLASRSIFRSNLATTPFSFRDPFGCR